MNPVLLLLCMYVCMSRSGSPPPWILKWGGLKISGQKPISSIDKTKRIAFFWHFFFAVHFLFVFFLFFCLSLILISFHFIFSFSFFFGLFLKVSKVTTKSYQGYYWTPKIVFKWAKTAY